MCITLVYEEVCIMAKQQSPKRSFIARAVGLDYLTRFGKSISDSILFMLHGKPSGRNETFEQAIERLHLTEKDIQKRQQHFLTLSLIFSFFALLVTIYCIYLAWNAHWIAAIISFSVVLIILTQVFRYHFWHFQVKQRRLGCSLKEWWNG